MKNYFEYKGYFGSAEFDTTTLVLVGKLLFIRDVIAYSAASPEGLRAAFEEAVEDYLATCAEVGDKPDVPCKGSFNIRVGPQLHREAALKARALGVGLNEFVCQAVASAVSGPLNHTVQHVHEHEHSVKVQILGEPTVMVATTQKPAQWEKALGARLQH